MKISINSKFLNGPYGGGMQFANYMKDFLVANGAILVNNLEDDDIDVILHVNPFPYLTPEISAYSYLKAYEYKLSHPETVIIERVNECDERKGTHYMNRQLVGASTHSDLVVFIASWLYPLLLKDGFPKNKRHTVILNGADTAVFNTLGKTFWDGTRKLKIVTHHWSANRNKGQDAYEKLNELLGQAPYKDAFEFTYIGRLDPSAYKNIHVVAPLSGKALGEELKRHDIYITASKNEPAGMHHIEGALCGLPLLYVNSGALPEYCSPYGLEFNPENIGEKILEMKSRFMEFKTKIQSYDNTAEKMARSYFHTIQDMYARRKEYILPEHSFLKKKLFSLYTRAHDTWFVIKKKLGMI